MLQCFCCMLQQSSFFVASYLFSLFNFKLLLAHSQAILPTFELDKRGCFFPKENINFLHNNLDRSVAAMPLRR